MNNGKLQKGEENKALRKYALPGVGDTVVVEGVVVVDVVCVVEGVVVVEVIVVEVVVVCVVADVVDEVVVVGSEEVDDVCVVKGVCVVVVAEDVFRYSIKEWASLPNSYVFSSKSVYRVFTHINMFSVSNT